MIVEPADSGKILDQPPVRQAGRRTRVAQGQVYVLERALAERRPSGAAALLAEGPERVTVIGYASQVD